MGLSHFLSDFLYMFLTVVLEYRSSKQIVVDARADAEEGNACGAESQSHTGVDKSLFFRTNRCFIYKINESALSHPHLCNR